MAAVKDKVVAVRMDHASGCLRFGEVAMESDAMRSQLTTLARQLFKVKKKKAPHTRTNRKTHWHHTRTQTGKHPNTLAQWADLGNSSGAGT